MMVAARTIVLAAMLVVAAASPHRARVRRQLVDDNTLQPLEDADSDEQTREKRKLEGVTQAKFGIKNAVLGFVFGDGTTSHHRTSRSTSPERVSLLQRKESTSDTPATSDTLNTLNTSNTLNTFSTLNTPNTFNTLNTDNSGKQSTARASQNTQDRSTGLSSNTKGSYTGSRGVRQSDDIPVFDRNKVSLDFPGSLFGPSLSLLIRTTKIVGDVVQNSAVRYQSFLRLFRPLFRGPFEIKGLDPATTTTTTTTTEAPPPKASDNEVRRR